MSRRLQYDSEDDASSLSSLSFDIESNQEPSDEELSVEIDNSLSDVGHLDSFSEGDAADDEQQQLETPRTARRRSSLSRSSPDGRQHALSVAQMTPTAPDRSRQTQFQALFVRVDPPLLRGLRHLELSALGLTRTQLQTLAANLFLLEALASISLADNQLEDSCTKELRAVLSLESLAHADLSKNLLGRGAAKMVADRLKHRLALRSLDVSGNPRFFAFDDAHEIARALAQGLVANLSIVDFRISVPLPQKHLERDRLILPQAPPPHQQSDKPIKSQRLQGRSFAPPGRSGSCTDRDREASPAEAFTRELGELQATAGGGLHSLGLVHAELSRRTVVNLMKLANRLVALDLSFAFVGISAAQVIATALKMKDYATLTQLNLRGNRLKSMGARALCRALHSNARLTDLNLSRNELRGELLPDLTEMLGVNHTLVRLDLTQNDELLAEVKEPSASWKAFVQALDVHCALLSLGNLERLSLATTTQREALKDALARNQQRSDERVLVGVHESMAFETGGSGPTLLGPVVTMVLSKQHQSEKTLWRQRREILKQARVSVKWKMRAFVPPTGAEPKRGRTVASSPLQHSTQSLRVHWRVVVHRKCDVAGTVEYDAASGAITATPAPSVGGFELCSALVYCDTKDVLSIVVSIEDDGNNEDGSSRGVEAVKVLAKEFVVLPHPLTLRHISFHYEGSGASRVLPSVEWLPKRVRDPVADVYPFTGELTEAYIARTGWYRLVWRVRVDAVRDATSTAPERLLSLLDEQLLWRVRRGHCWAQDDTVVILEGSCRELQSVVRNDRDLVVCTQPLEFVAGELVRLHAETKVGDSALRLLQWFVLDETPAWENAPPTGASSPPR